MTREPGKRESDLCTAARDFLNIHVIAGDDEYLADDIIRARSLCLAACPRWPGRERAREMCPRESAADVGAVIEISEGARER